jgi:hypothetical protein
MSVKSITMRKISALLSLLFLVASLVGCDDIIAKNISEQTPVVLIPAVNDTVKINPVHFKWEAMEGATKYHLQVVSPSFSGISDYVLDTIITKTSFSFSLDSNVFEMKLTAINAGYNSKTTNPLKFWVGVNASPVSNSVVLTSPSDTAYVNDGFSRTFTWQTLSTASNYELSIRKGTSFSIGSIEYTKNNIASNTITIPSSDINFSEGIYWWGVKAYSATGETYYSTRKLSVDMTEPNDPALTSPLATSVVNAGEVVFTWNNGTDLGTVKSPVYSTIEVSGNSSFTDIKESADLVGNTKSFTLTSGIYFWRVKNVDKAGNASSYSASIQFTVL